MANDVANPHHHRRRRSVSSSRRRLIRDDNAQQSRPPPSSARRSSVGNQQHYAPAKQQNRSEFSFDFRNNNNSNQAPMSPHMRYPDNSNDFLYYPHKPPRNSHVLTPNELTTLKQNSSKKSAAFGYNNYEQHLRRQQLPSPLQDQLKRAPSFIYSPHNGIGAHVPPTQTNFASSNTTKIITTPFTDTQQQHRSSNAHYYQVQAAPHDYYRRQDQLLASQLERNSSARRSRRSANSVERSKTFVDNALVPNRFRRDSSAYRGLLAGDQDESLTEDERVTREMAAVAAYKYAKSPSSAHAPKISNDKNSRENSSSNSSGTVVSDNQGNRRKISADFDDSSRKVSGAPLPKKSSNNHNEALVYQHQSPPARQMDINSWHDAYQAKLYEDDKNQNTLKPMLLKTNQGDAPPSLQRLTTTTKTTWQLPLDEEQHQQALLTFLTAALVSTTTPEPDYQNHSSRNTSNMTMKPTSTGAINRRRKLSPGSGGANIRMPSDSPISSSSSSTTSSTTLSGSGYQSSPSSSPLIQHASSIPMPNSKSTVLVDNVVTSSDSSIGSSASTLAANTGEINGGDTLSNNNNNKQRKHVRFSEDEDQTHLYYLSTPTPTPQHQDTNFDANSNYTTTQHQIINSANNSGLSVTQRLVNGLGKLVSSTTNFVTANNSTSPTRSNVKSSSSSSHNNKRASVSPHQHTNYAQMWRESFHLHAPSPCNSPGMVHASRPMTRRFDSSVSNVRRSVEPITPSKSAGVTAKEYTIPINVEASNVTKSTLNQTTNNEQQQQSRSFESIKLLNPNTNNNFNSSNYYTNGAIKPRTLESSGSDTGDSGIHRSIASSSTASSSDSSRAASSELLEAAHTSASEQEITRRNEAIKHIDTILKQTRAISDEIDAFRGTKNDSQYRYLNEMLTRYMVQLDIITSEGIEDIRNRRKQAVHQLQTYATQLDRKGQQKSNPVHNDDEEDEKSFSRSWRVFDSSRQDDKNALPPPLPLKRRSTSTQVLSKILSTPDSDDSPPSQQLSPLPTHFVSNIMLSSGNNSAGGAKRRSSSPIQWPSSKGNVDMQEIAL